MTPCTPGMCGARRVKQSTAVRASPPGVGTHSTSRMIRPCTSGVRAAKGDHTACAPESKRWTAGKDVTDGFAYHPTALGHQKMAALISKALKSRRQHAGDLHLRRELPNEGVTTGFWFE